jgi:hypothetical protein
VTPSDRDILERAVATISEQAAKASSLIDEAMYAGLPADHPVTVAAKMMRLEILKTKAELERTRGVQPHLRRLRPQRALGERHRERGGPLVARGTGPAWRTGYVTLSRS